MIMNGAFRHSDMVLCFLGKVLFLWYSHSVIESISTRNEYIPNRFTSLVLNQCKNDS